MTSDLFWPFLTYLPCPTIFTLKRPIFGGFFGPRPTLKSDVIFGRSLKRKTFVFQPCMNRKADFVVFYMDIEHQSSGTLENVKHVKITSSSDAKPLYGLRNNGLRSFFLRSRPSYFLYIPKKIILYFSRFLRFLESIFFFNIFTLLCQVGN